MVNRDYRKSATDPDSTGQLSPGARLSSAAEDLSAILQETIDSAREVTGASCAALAVLSEDSAQWETFIMSGVPSEMESMIRAQPVGGGLLGLLDSNSQPIRIKDLSTHPAAAEIPCHHPAMTSFLGVPVKGKSGIMGGLLLTDRKGEPEFSQADEAVAVVLAKHAASAIDNARLLEQTKLLLQEVKEMKETRERFYATINHELRNALTAVYGWAELWLRKTGDDTPRPAIEVYESAELALLLLEDMLQLSRMDAGRLFPLIQEADAAACVRESVHTIQPSAARKEIRVQVSGADKKLPCRTDPVRVRQILTNLLQNAVRHSPDADVIDVEVQADDEAIRIDVVDYGEGFPEGLHEEIFKAFDLNWEHHEHGSGLGLDVSRRLARLLGGDLRVEGKSGHGARFILELPRRGVE